MLKVRSREQGFSLIELLTVIAIIAILAAMIFPAMTAVKQRANQTKCMSNMMNIANAVKMYKLDNRKFPEALAYRTPDSTSPAPMTFDRYLSRPSPYPGVLSGDYGMKTMEVYRCPSSKNTDFSAVVEVQDPFGSPVMMNVGGQKTIAYYFKSDDYDVYNDNGVWRAKYVYEWARNPDEVNDFAADPGAADNPILAKEEDYKRQLKWRDPPDDTVLTWCSNHGGTKDVVVFLSGTARPIAHNIVENSKWRTRLPKL